MYKLQYIYKYISYTYMLTNEIKCIIEWNETFNVNW